MENPDTQAPAAKRGPGRPPKSAPTSGENTAETSGENIGTTSGVKLPAASGAGQSGEATEKPQASTAPAPTGLTMEQVQQMLAERDKTTAAEFESLRKSLSEAEARAEKAEKRSKPSVPETPKPTPFKTEPGEKIVELSMLRNYCPHPEILGGFDPECMDNHGKIKKNRIVSVPESLADFLISKGLASRDALLQHKQILENTEEQLLKAASDVVKANTEI